MVKNSRFIADIYPASNSDEAQKIINSIKQRYPDARHHCWAYIAGAPDGTDIRFSDDGEPSGTAGKPILNVLQHSGLGEIVAVVTRYFGGIKLGAGGLVRAYSSSTQAAMEQLQTLYKQAKSTVEVVCPFALESQVRQLADNYQAEMLAVSYAEAVCFQLQLADVDLDDFVMQLTNQSKGQAQCNPISSHHKESVNDD